MKTSTTYLLTLLATTILLAGCSSSQLSFEKRRYNKGNYINLAQKDRIEKQAIAESKQATPAETQEAATPDRMLCATTVQIPVEQPMEIQNQELTSVNDKEQVTTNLEMKDIIRLAVKLKSSSDQLKGSKLIRRANKKALNENGQTRRRGGGAAIFAMGLILGGILVLVGIIIYALNAGNKSKTTTGAIILFVGLGVILLGALLSWLA